jgi:hypothetical protein
MKLHSERRHAPKKKKKKNRLANQTTRLVKKHCRGYAPTLTNHSGTQIPQRPDSCGVLILLSLDSLEDLFNCAALNTTFYHVFKRHELTLIKNALFYKSPPAGGAVRDTATMGN